MLNLTETLTDHECYIDCEPILDVHPISGKIITVGHVMYPAEPNRDAGRYQASQNINMTRREYRASGQDESRNVRKWNYERSQRIRNTIADIKFANRPLLDV